MTVGSTNESNLSPFRAISTITRPFRARIGLFALCTFGVGLLEALFLVVVTRAALAIAGGETVVGVTRNVELTVNETALAGLGILLVRFVLYYLTARVQTGLQYRITAGYRKKLGGSFLASPWMKQSQQPPGFLQQVVVQFPSQIAALVGSMSNALSGGLALLALLGIALAINAVSTLLVFGALVVLAVILVPIARSIRRTSARALEHQVEFANRVSEVSDLSLEINAFGVREPVRKALNDLIDDEAASTRRVGLTSSLVSPIYMSLAYGAVLVGLLAINSFGANDINEVGAVMLIMMRCLGYGQQTQQGLTAIGQHTPYAERILATTRFFDADSAAPGDTHLVQLSRIEFEDVSFSYPGREASLMGVSFALAFGEVIGVVGPSGSGKTTLIQMLLGLLPPESGTIKVDGIPLSDVDLRDWNRIACYVPQEAKLLSGTIAENVRFYRTGISDEEVLRALRDANFVLDAERFPQSIDTDIGTSGRQLSGGQSQRLAIARALATNPTLLILDEPTSALDASSEEVIAETLGRLRGRVTTVVVSHRESTLEICDRRLLVSAGRVSYEPTHS